jgi:predicted enzyme related to lactoylglutathione lyase
VPPHWNNYVTVASADDTSAKARELGGNVMMEPFDIPAGDGSTAGRMSVLFDPANAGICIWQPGGHIGAEIVNAHGALTWNELHTSDIDAAESFYGGLFGWTFEAMETGSGGPAYHVISNGERSNGGIMEAHGGMPPNWLPYFAVDHLDEAIEKAKSADGDAINDPIPMPQGRIVALRDPQGAPFALWEGQLED